MTTVLLVEDQLELRAVFEAYLLGHGYRVLTADDGDTGLAAARASHPDIIVLDHSLPRRNGVDVARELHGDPATAGIPILMISAHTYGAVGQKARAAGCVSFLTKPIPPSRLLQEVARYVQSSASA